MPRLTEQEQQEIIRFIEADKALPDRYRFLLFEDKREVELVWNGKTSEVCNIVLPFQVIEQVDEPRAETPSDTKGDLSLFKHSGISMDGRGRYLDHFFIERLWRSLKQEAVYLHELQDGFQAKRVIDSWIGFYNAERPHTALDKRTPDDAYFDPIQMNQAA